MSQLFVTLQPTADWVYMSAVPQRLREGGDK